MKSEIKTCAINAEEVVQALEKEKTMILATCSENRVTIRPMSHINDGLSVYFQAGADSVKMQQIRENPNVAMCVGTCELEGVATELGHPLAENNAFFAQGLKAKHPDAFERWSSLEDEVVVKVVVKRARQWRYIEDEPFLAEAEFDKI